jgi:hypothetical protein
MNPIFGYAKVVNLTPHPIRVLDEDGSVVQEWESSGQLRISYDYTPGVVRTAKISGITGIELAEGADVLIVSRAMAMVPLGLPENVRVYYPDGEIRNPANMAEVVGCKHLTAIDRSNDAAAAALALNNAYSSGFGGASLLTGTYTPGSARESLRFWGVVNKQLKALENPTELDAINIMRSTPNQAVTS